MTGKIKRNKQNRKTMLHFRMQHRFLEPYKLLVDGPFVHKALEGKIDIRNDIVDVTAGRTFTTTTRCVMAELKAGGDQLRGAMLAARRFNCVNCDHVPGTNPHDCIKDLIGKANKDKYVVGSGDPGLTATLRKRSCVPLMWISLNVMQLEKPPTEDWAAEEPEPKPQFSQETQAMLDDVAAAEENKKKKRGRKEPNPMSCKKKKTIAPPPPSKPKADPQPKPIAATQGEGGKRRRRRKSKAAPTPVADEL